MVCVCVVKPRGPNTEDTVPAQLLQGKLFKTLCQLVSLIS